MPYDFDAIINRKNTNSTKYDFAEENGYPADVLPMWVADMDFQAPPATIRALQAMASHGIYGYTGISKGFFPAIEGWFRSRHGFSPKEEWMLLTPGVVFAVAAAIRAYTAPGDGVLIQPPVYYPFGNMIRANGRKVINNPLIYKDGRYEIDFQDFARKVKKAKLFILCSPHNPVGRVWSREDLARMGEICNQNGVIVLSDEIHCDFIFEGYSHPMYPTLGRAFANNCVLCTAPSKTFNLAGLQFSTLFVPNAKLRRLLATELGKTGVHMPGLPGLVAAEAAYREGAGWLDALLPYLAENVQLVQQFVAERLPKLRVIQPEGTYLLWLDCRALGLDDSALERLIVQDAKIWLDMGNMFGKEGTGFVRLNLGCPRATVRQAMEQLEGAIRRNQL